MNQNNSSVINVNNLSSKAPVVRRDVVIVTLRAKAYDVKILNDVITSLNYFAIVCERSLRQQ